MPNFSCTRLVLVQQLVGILLVGIVVLAEDDILQVTLGIHQRQGVDLVVPDDVVAVVLELKARTGHSTIAITADGTPNGKLLGIVASRDYRVNHTPDDAPVTTFMTPIEKLVTAPENTSLHDCNNIIWDNKRCV